VNHPAFSELIVSVFPTTLMIAVGLPNTGKYGKIGRIVGDSAHPKNCEISLLPRHMADFSFLIRPTSSKPVSG
jgi:hypothetical protein